MHFTTFVLLPAVLALPTALVKKTTTGPSTQIAARQDGVNLCPVPAVSCQAEGDQNTWKSCDPSTGAWTDRGSIPPGETCDVFMSGYTKRDAIPSVEKPAPMSVARSTIQPPSILTKRDVDCSCPTRATCDDGAATYQQCFQGAMVDMGAIAPGQTCADVLGWFESQSCISNDPPPQ